MYNAHAVPDSARMLTVFYVKTALFILRQLGCGPSKPTLVVAGPTVFICRECVGICVDLMSDDPEWRDKQIRVLSAKGKPKTNLER
jgi:hypothetical protein